MPRDRRFDILMAYRVLMMCPVKVYLKRHMKRAFKQGLNQRPCSLRVPCDNYMKNKNERMKRSVFISIALIAFCSYNVQVAAQKNTHLTEFQKENRIVTIKGTEDFGQFLKVFYTDSLFQMSRIVFPLKGERNIDVPITATNVMGDSIIDGWEKKEWRMLTDTYFPSKDTVITIDNERYVRKIKKGNETAVIDTYIEDSGFSVKEVFALKKKKWYLVLFSTLSY